MNKTGKAFLDKFIDDILYEILKDVTVKFIMELRPCNLKNTFTNKINKVLFFSSTFLTFSFLLYQKLDLLFSISFSIFSYFIYKSIIKECREEVLRRKYNTFTTMFNGKAKIVNVVKENNYVNYIVHSFVPRDQITSMESNIEHYLNTNIVSIELDKYNKRLLTIYTSKNPVTIPSSLEGKLISILNSYDFNAKLNSIDSNDFFENIRINCKTDIKKVLAKYKDIAYKLNIDIHRLHIYIDKGEYVFQIKKIKQKTFLFSDYIDSMNIPKHYILPVVTGIYQETNKPVINDMTNLGHILDVGRTGSGKSTTAHMLIQSMMYLHGSENTKFIMFDYKTTELRKYKDFKNTTYLGDDEEKLINTLKEINKEVKRRFEFLSDNDYPDVNSYNVDHPKTKIPTIIIIIDEAAEIMLSKNADELNDTFTSMFNRFRAANVFLMFILQKHSVNQVDSRIRGQFMTEFLHKFDNKDKKGLIIPVDVSKLTKGEYFLNSEKYDYTKMKGLLIDNKNNDIYKRLKEKYSCVNDCVDLCETSETHNKNFFKKDVSKAVIDLTTRFKKISGVEVKIIDNCVSNKFTQLDFDKQYILLVKFYSRESIGVQLPTDKVTMEYLGLETRQELRKLKTKLADIGFLVKNNKTTFVINKNHNLYKEVKNNA